MKLLEEKVLQEGIAVNENILKVDSFINHQIDPVLMKAIGEDFADHFKDCGITKVVTIESSGIAPAFSTALWFWSITALESLSPFSIPAIAALKSSIMIRSSLTHWGR